MLSELVINDFAIIDQLKIEFWPGFNVLTGETGAGKSIILDAMALVLGERADTNMIRTGSDRAYVEAVFEVGSLLDDLNSSILKEEGLDSEDGYLTLAREIRTNGRNISRVNGRTANLNIVRTIGEMLVDIHGQGEHLTLLRSQSHKYLLDAFGSLERDREQLAGEVDRLSGIRTEITQIRSNQRESERREDLLRYQLEEIAAANLDHGEEEDLRDERVRLANAESLIQNLASTLQLLEGGQDEGLSISVLLGQAERSLRQLAVLDPSLKTAHERLSSISYDAADVISELLSYQEKLEFNPTRLDYVEERLELISQLKRKYGSSIQEILTFAEKASHELEELERGADNLAALEKDEQIALHKVGELSAELSDKRREAASKLSEAVEIELAQLKMAQARFSVDFSYSEDADGLYVGEKRLAFDRSGIDKIEFLVSANPGESLRPLAKVASGGETSRLMLALKSALAKVDQTPTLIFDEIDQGIGGRVGDIVGHKLWSLTNTQRHQVIVVTHLPQLAGYADGHFHISKEIADGRTVTRVKILDQDSRIEELASMLGTKEESASRGAESILERAAEVKRSPPSF